MPDMTAEEMTEGTGYTGGYLEADFSVNPFDQESQKPQLDEPTTLEPQNSKPGSNPESKAQEPQLPLTETKATPASHANGSEESKLYRCRLGKNMIY